MIAWREKWIAFGLHFIVTLVFSAAAAALVFLIWYPDPFPTMLGVGKVFLILLGCDLALGPLSSLIIYNSKKSRRTLLFDYTVIGIAQLAAFIYGIHTVASGRPVYIVFARDHLEVVSAIDLEDADLAQGSDGYRERPKWGPRLVGTQVQLPRDSNKKAAMLASLLAGKDLALLPKYYVPYEQTLAQIKQQARPVTEIEQRHPDAKPLLASAAAQIEVPIDKLRWLPVRHRRGVWTALIDPDTALPLRWLPVDPS